MKISELQELASVDKAAKIPVALYGENHSVTIGKIVDALQKNIVWFYAVLPVGTVVVYADGSSTTPTTPVYDDNTGRFYGAVFGKYGITLYSDFPNYSDYYYEAGGGIRGDCLYVTHEGELFYCNEKQQLVRAGLTAAQAETIKKLTPIQLESESELEALKAAGEIKPGQMYFIAEDE